MVSISVRATRAAPHGEEERQDQGVATSVSRVRLGTSRRVIQTVKKSRIFWKGNDYRDARILMSGSRRPHARSGLRNRDIPPWFQIARQSIFHANRTANPAYTGRRAFYSVIEQRLVRPRIRSRRQRGKPKPRRLCRCKGAPKKAACQRIADGLVVKTARVKVKDEEVVGSHDVAPFQGEPG